MPDGDKLTPQQFAQNIKAKYPAYQSMDDSELVQKIITKYPQYKNNINFDSKEVQQQPQQDLQKTLQDYSATHQQSKNASLGYDNAFVPKGMNGGEIITAKEKADDDKLTNAAINTFNKTQGRGSHTQADSVTAINQLKQGVKNGDLGITQDAQGNDVIKNSGNFFQSFKAASDQAYAQDIENKYLRSISKNEAINYLNRIQQKPETGIVKESDIAPNGLGEAVGSQSQLVGKTTIGGMALGETGLTGGSSAGGFLAIANDLANSGYSQALKKNYYELKKEGISDSEAFDKATNAALTGEATSLGTGALLSGELKISPKTIASTEGFLNSLKHTIKTAPKVVGSAGVASVVNDIQTNAIANGNPIDAKKMWNNSVEAMKPMLTIHSILGGLAAITNGQKTIVPSYSRPQMENVAASLDRNQVQQIYQQGEQSGEFPQGTTQKVLQKLNEFDAQKRVVENLPIPEENKAAITGRLIQKQDLLDEKASLKPNENALPKRIADIDKEISGVDGEINKFYDAKNVFQKEKDALTGEGGTQPKQFDELKKQEQDGIVVPKEYGATDVTEKGEGENKTFSPKAFYLEKQGALEIKKNIPIDEKNFTDKDKAQAAADNALKQHYYENGLHDNAKPDKKIEKEKNQTLPASENNEAGNSSNGFVSSNETGKTEKGVGEVVQPQQKIADIEQKKNNHLDEVKSYIEAKNITDKNEIKERINVASFPFDVDIQVAKGMDLNDAEKYVLDSYKNSSEPTTENKPISKPIQPNSVVNDSIDEKILKLSDKKLSDLIHTDSDELSENDYKIKKRFNELAKIKPSEVLPNIDKYFANTSKDQRVEKGDIIQYVKEKLNTASEKSNIPNSVVEGENGNFEKNNQNENGTVTKSSSTVGVGNVSKVDATIRGSSRPASESTVGDAAVPKGIGEETSDNARPLNAEVKKLLDRQHEIANELNDERKKLYDKFGADYQNKIKNEPNYKKLKAKSDALLKENDDINNQLEKLNPKTNSIVEDKQTNENISQPLNTEQENNNPSISETDNTNPPEPPKEEPPLSEGADDGTTSIKNATTRLRREQYGLDEEIPAAKKEFGDTWNEAKDKIENGYNPQDLIDELAKKPRPVTDVENAILLHAQNTKEINLINLNEQINKAAENENAQALQEAKVAKARVLDELQKIYDVNKAVGTENARGLASRQMMVDRKYSLANMLSEKRATANDGKPLSEEQQAQVEELHKKINETQKAFDDYVKEAELEIKGLQEKILGKKITNKKSAAQKLRDFADKIEKNSIGQTYAAVIPITPKMIAGAMRLIADGLEKGEDVLNLIKNAIEKIKGENSDIDEAKLRKAINSEVINSNIISTTEKAAKQNKDYSRLLFNNKLDRKALELNAASERAKNEFDISLKKDEASKKSFFQKTQNVFVKWQRAFKLSNPLTMGKLVMAGLTRLTTTPLEDVVGAGYSQVLPQLAKGAIGEGGGLNVTETAKAYKDGLLEGMKDAATIMKKGSQGKSDIDVSFGKLGELPPEAIDFFGQLHSATKAPIKRAAFERSLSKRLRRGIANGVDVSDPLVQTEILTGAYKDANRAIFMQDNKVATGFQNLVKYFEQEDKQTGKAVNKPLATTLQWMLPFVKIPTNIAAETGAHVYGVPLEIGKGIVRMFDKNESKLTADEKDVIFRNLKKGTLGVAALALGYFNPQNFGGYYQKGQKRQDDDAQALGLKLFGKRIPAWFVEAPIFQAMQLGATIRRVKDDKVKGVEKGIGEGVWAGALGLVDRIPMVDQPMRMADLFSSERDRKYYMGELAKSTIDPALITYLANATDPADNKSIAGKILNPENKRSPQTMLEHIKSGIPYFREQVGEKPQSFNEQDKKDPTFKYFLDKGLQLPNTSLSSEEVPNTGNHISDYPKDIQDKYTAEHKAQLKNELQSIKNKNYVYVNSVKNLKGEIINDVATHKKDSKSQRISLDKLTTDELAQVLHIAQSQATAKAKKKIFK